MDYLVCCCNFWSPCRWILLCHLRVWNVFAIAKAHQPLQDSLQLRFFEFKWETNLCNIWRLLPAHTQVLAITMIQLLVTSEKLLRQDLWNVFQNIWVPYILSRFHFQSSAGHILHISVWSSCGIIKNTYCDSGKELPENVSFQKIGLNVFDRFACEAYHWMRK